MPHILDQHERMLKAIREIVSITTEKRGTAYTKVGRIRALLREFDDA